MNRSGSRSVLSEGMEEGLAKKEPMPLRSWVACCLCVVQVREDPQVCKIFPRAPFMDEAKGPRIREQPLGRVTRVVANSFSVELKCLHAS